MDLKEFALALKTSTGLPLAYHHFESGSAPELPYLVYFVADRDDDVIADNKAYVKVRSLYVELYTVKKYLAAEELVESFFDDLEVGYTVEETYLYDEKMFERIYALEI